MSDTPFCINCKWIYKAAVPLCNYEKAPHSPVDGLPTQTCVFMREERLNHCAPHGIWFEDGAPVIESPVVVPPVSEPLVSSPPVFGRGAYDDGHRPL